MKIWIKTLYIIQIFLLIQLFVLAFLYFRDYPRLIFYDFIFTSVYSLLFIIFILFQKIKPVKKLIPIVIITCYSLFFYFNLELFFIGSYYRFIIENKQELNKWIESNDINQPPKVKGIEFVDIDDSTYFICLRIDNIQCEGVAYSYKKNGEKVATMRAMFNTQSKHLFGRWFYWSGDNDY